MTDFPGSVRNGEPATGGDNGRGPRESRHNSGSRGMPAMTGRFGAPWPAGHGIREVAADGLADHMTAGTRADAERGRR